MRSFLRVCRALTALRSILIFAALIPVARAGDWTKIETPWFTVISEVSERRTRAWASEFEIYRRGLEKLVPLQPGQVERVTIILFSSDRRFNAYKPLENGKPSKLAGYFVRMPGRNILALAAEGARDDTRELIYHEGVHWYLSGLDQPLPLWLEEGLSEMFGTFVLSGNTFKIGADRPYYTRHVRIAKPMPFAQLSASRPGELQFNGKHADHSELFYAQSWAAVHDLVCTEGSDGWPKLQMYLQLAPTSDDATQNFATAFGLDAAAMDARMKNYLRGTRLTTFKYTFDRSNIEEGFVLSAATAAEVDLVLGNLLLGAHRADEAEACLWRAAAAMPKDPRPREALAEIEIGKRDLSAAVDHYRVAESLGGRSYAGYFLMGAARLANAGPGGLSDDVIEESVENFVQATLRNARFRPAYESLALLARDFAPTSQAARQVIEGARRFPISAELHFGLSQLASRERDWTKARAEANRALALLGNSNPRLRRFLTGHLERIEHEAGAAVR